LVHSPSLNCIAAQMRGQLLRKAVVRLETTLTTHLASVVTQNHLIVVLLPDQRSRQSGIMSHLHLRSRISLSGGMPSILSQLLKSRALSASLPLRVQQTCLVSIFSLACVKSTY
jgi:hypothetical protein